MISLERAVMGPVLLCVVIHEPEKGLHNVIIKRKYM